MKYVIFAAFVILAFYLGFYVMFIGGIMDLYTMFVVEKAVTSLGLAIGAGKILFSGVTVTLIVFVGAFITGAHK